jgi:hypothetical protein
MMENARRRQAKASDRSQIITREADQNCVCQSQHSHKKPIHNEIRPGHSFLSFTGFINFFQNIYISPIKFITRIYSMIYLMILIMHNKY